MGRAEGNGEGVEEAIERNGGTMRGWRGDGGAEEG